MSDTISACCHAEIRAYIPHSSFYRASPREPIPYCTACELTNPEEIEDEPKLCHHCHGKGIEPDEDKPEEVKNE